MRQPILLMLLFFYLPAFAGSVGLTCAETAALIDATVQHLARVDERKRREMQWSLPIFFHGVGYVPTQFYENGDETRIVAKVAIGPGVGVLKVFNELPAAMSFVAQMNQLRDNGIVGVEVIGRVDMGQRAVRVKHYQLCSLEWLEGLKLPEGLLAKLFGMRAAFTERASAVGARLQILDKPISATNILLDLDSDSFRLIDIK